MPGTLNLTANCVLVSYVVSSLTCGSSWYLRLTPVGMVGGRLSCCRPMWYGYLHIQLIMSIVP